MNDKLDQKNPSDDHGPDDIETLQAEVDLDDVARAAYEAACARMGECPEPRMSREECEKVLSRTHITYQQYAKARTDSDDESREVYDWAIRQYGYVPRNRMSKSWCEVIIRCYENQRAG